METRDRHLKLLTETIEAVNSTLDLQEVLAQVASNVASALEADACFVYLYDERADDLVLRATHGTRVDEMTRRPRLRPGEGITGSAASERAPVMLESQAHLDPRFKHFPNLPEDEYESILAVPILTRDGTLEGALNVRTREPRAFGEDEVELLLAIAAQVAQSIEHAKLYAEAQRRVQELEALARISEAVSNSLYLEESLEAIVKTTMDALSATGAALVLDDGRIAWPEGIVGEHALRQPLRWRGRQIGELVADRATPFTEAEGELLASIATHAAVALEHGRAVMRGVLAQEVHHRVKNNLQTVASLLRLQARSTDVIDPREALEHSVNRILAIAAVHELLTERRDEDVDLADLIDRLRAMLVQGVGGGKDVTRRARAGVDLRRARDRAGARLLRAAAERARARRADACAVELARRGGDVGARDRGRRRGHRRGAERRHRALDRPGARARRAARHARPALGRRHARRGRLPGLGSERSLDAPAARRSGGRRRRRAGRAARRGGRGRRPSSSCRRERERARRDAGKRGAQLREAPLLAELGKHGHRPLAQQRVRVAGGEDARGRRSPRRARAGSGRTRGAAHARSPCCGARSPSDSSASSARRSESPPTPSRRCSSTNRAPPRSSSSASAGGAQRW